MKTSIVAAAAALMALSVPLGAAQAADQNRSGGHDQHSQTQQQPGRDNNPRQDNRQNDQRGQQNGDSRYGRWDSNWGARPPAPPSHFTRHSDWYRHVRACQQRYRSYNPRTDRYVPRRGQTAICRL